MAVNLSLQSASCRVDTIDAPVDILLLTLLYVFEIDNVVDGLDQKCDSK
jgi:hypothetical protein